MSGPEPDQRTADLPALPARPEDGHKGTFGTVCVVGGQAPEGRVMIGGPALSALAALRTGCGLAILALPEPIINSGLAIAPSATGLALPVDSRGGLRTSAANSLLDQYLPGCDCLAIGPGLGDGQPQQQLMLSLISRDDVAMVIDADALNALAHVNHFAEDLRAAAVLTPHPGEFQRLARVLQIDLDPAVPEQRRDAAERLAQRLGCIVVLKGRHTLISDGVQTIVNTTGNVALATAGTGDVLTGIIASLVAQFFKPHLGVGSRQISPHQQGGLSLLQCAQLGVFLHGLAAEHWSEKHRANAGLLAADLLEYIPGIVHDLRAGRSTTTADSTAVGGSSRV